MKKKQTIYEFSMRDYQGRMISFSQFEGKILLIVNTAIHCGFTPLYQNLENLYQKYHRYGFEILDFPCNQFHGQAPESDEEINRFCLLNYQTTFPRFRKVEVKGENAEPLFTFLCKKKKFRGFDKGHPLSPILASIHIKEGPGWEENNEIKWNFTMFLLDRYGKVISRFEPTTDMKKVEKAIERLIDSQWEEQHE